MKSNTTDLLQQNSIHPGQICQFAKHNSSKSRGKSHAHDQNRSILLWKPLRDKFHLLYPKLELLHHLLKKYF